jgi:hypothetical protein
VGNNESDRIETIEMTAGQSMSFLGRGTRLTGGT